jgi:hypothetical protein
MANPYNVGVDDPSVAIIHHVYSDVSLDAS